MNALAAVISFASFLIEQFPDLEEEFQKALVGWSKTDEGKAVTLALISEENHEDIDRSIDKLIAEQWAKR